MRRHCIGVRSRRVSGLGHWLLGALSRNPRTSRATVHHNRVPGPVAHELTARVDPAGCRVEARLPSVRRRCATARQRAPTTRAKAKGNPAAGEGRCHLGPTRASLWPGRTEADPGVVPQAFGRSSDSSFSLDPSDECGIAARCPHDSAHPLPPATSHRHVYTVCYCELRCVHEELRCP